MELDALRAHVEEAKNDPDYAVVWSHPLPPGVPCHHPGCLRHISHPCEGCGRIGGRYPDGE
jgi:hypothetical protein